MAFTSYAQNFEDVMLWRALSHVTNGRYIDIGAQHPVIDSVSLAFYERGWRGTHVEPVPAYAALLRQHRSDETVIEAALTDVDGPVELNVIPATGLSTLIDAHAAQHVQAGQSGVQRIVVAGLTARTALRQLAGQPVHWMKIDVEGAEAAVLAGWDSGAIRPWVMVIEATLPGSAVADHQSWEATLLAADYRLAWFDGLNRYYVAAEHSGLAAAFSSPPNVFDDIRLTRHSILCSDLVSAHAKAQREAEERLAAAAKAAAEQLAALNAQLAASAAQAAALAGQLQAIQRSSSWKITAPLRRAVGLLRRIRRRLFRPPEASPPVLASAQDLSPRAARIHQELRRACAAGNSHAHTD